MFHFRTWATPGCLSNEILGGEQGRRKKKNRKFSSSELECWLKIPLLPKGWKGSSRTHILRRTRNSLRIVQFSENVTKVQTESVESNIFCREAFPINKLTLVQLQLSGQFLMSNNIYFRNGLPPPLRVTHFSLIPPFPLQRLESCMLCPAFLYGWVV